MAAAETITVPRPAPHEAVIAITDADGASCWVTIRKTDLTDGEHLVASLLPVLEDGQRIVYEQRDSKASA